MSALRRFMPLFDRVLVQRMLPVQQTKAGILIPESNQKKELTAKVMAVGSGAVTEEGKVIPNAVEVGDEVFLPEFGGTKVVLDETEYYLYRNSDFLAKIKPE